MLTDKEKFQRQEHFALLLEDIKELSSGTRQRIEQYLGNRAMWSDLQLKALFDQIDKLRESVASELVARNAWTAPIIQSDDVLILNRPHYRQQNPCKQFASKQGEAAMCKVCGFVRAYHKMEARGGPEDLLNEGEK